MVTIVIPVYNGGHAKSRCRILPRQDLNESFEVLLIDSSSNDGCLDALPYSERLPHTPVKKILAMTHCTLGVELARGKYVAFITQDAIPANRMWLMNLIDPLQNDLTGWRLWLLIAHIDMANSQPMT